jgi:hypothetical protein
LVEDPENAFSGNGNKYKDQARIAELERLLGQAYAEIELSKKAFAKTQKIIQDAVSDGLKISISESCRALEVSYSSYYKRLKQPEIDPSANSKYMDLKNQIQEIALEFPRNDYRRITAELLKIMPMLIRQCIGMSAISWAKMKSLFCSIDSNAFF